jgi:hypothetical protein
MGILDSAIFQRRGTLMRYLQKKGSFFLIFMIPNVYWMGYTISHKTYPLTAVQIIYTVFNIWGYFKWRKEKKK